MKSLRWNDEDFRWEVWVGEHLVSTHSSYLDAYALHPELRTQRR